jgi:alkanesulfonate monooxygenase SsuD/methylene tetrahydromethanopterin reductase-like flavin-dependent oxidoreductase (luciferase family)
MKTLVWSSSAIPVTPETREELRPVARNPALYQRMLASCERIAVWCDEYGYDGFGTTEHHFQTEGGETIPNNLLFFTKLATLTKRIMFVPMSVVLSASDPIRTAENLALFDNMFPGRVGVTFARGYQTRWMQTLSQAEGISSSPMDPASDARNLEIYDEYLAVVQQAWEQDSFNHSGRHYQAPYPATGIKHWPLTPWTRRFGSPGEVDENGTVHRIGVVPKPTTTPRVFIPTTGSRQTVVDAAQRGHALLMLVGDRERTVEIAKLYRDEAKAAGRDFAPGENIGVVAKITVGDTYDEAFDLAVRTSGYVYQNFFSNFGITQMYRNESDGPGMYEAADERALSERMVERGDLICGTAEQVHEGLAELRGLYGHGQLDWLVWESFTQTLPDDELNEVAHAQLKTMAEDILPDLR